MHVIPVVALLVYTFGAFAAVKHGVAAVRGAALVEVHAHREGDHVRIMVSDNGPGLDAERRIVTDARRGGTAWPTFASDSTAISDPKRR